MNNLRVKKREERVQELPVRQTSINGEERQSDVRTAASGRGVTERLSAFCINDRLERARRDRDRPTVNLMRSESIEKRSNSDDRYLAVIASDGEVD